MTLARQNFYAMRRGLGISTGDGPMEIHSGDHRLVDLGNEISDAVHKALTSGLGADFVCSMLVGCAADYWMQCYERPVTSLANILRAKEQEKGRP